MGTSNASEQKNKQRAIRLAWLARIFSNDKSAATDELAEEMLVEHHPDYHISTFVEGFRPLRKYLDKAGPVSFDVSTIDHSDGDRSYASLSVNGEVIFELVVRFEVQAPYRVMYWMSHPPLPAGVSVRRYQPEDAGGCVALERACPMEMLDGSQWIIDRGVYFNDYLNLMQAIDAAVVVDHNAGDQIIGFFSCALRPVRYHGEQTFCIYQHHYRVHPDHRAGSVSQALAAFIDPRRTFQNEMPAFPYAMVDPNNAHLQHMGFPKVDDVTIARLALPATAGTNSMHPVQDAQLICELINTTHAERSLFTPYTPASLAQRVGQVDSYSAHSFFGDENAVLGLWRVGEVNIGIKDGVEAVSKVHFVMDYGFRSLAAFEDLIQLVLTSELTQGATHLAFICDTRATEYPFLHDLADDEQNFDIQTLPFTADAFKDGVTYCDAIYC
ncbi:MAG: hypothetical protein AAF541_05425 [Pseudomonadota bacterium]